MKNFAKTIIISILIIYSFSHYKNFLKINNYFFSNLKTINSEKSYILKNKIFHDLSKMKLEGYFITTTSTASQTHKIGLKPILLKTDTFNFLPYHPYLVNRVFDILKNVYAIDYRNPPSKTGEGIPDGIIKENFEKKNKDEWNKISANYNANYLVVPADWKIELKNILSENGISVYKIE